jgi:hypothetical protein
MNKIEGPRSLCKVAMSLYMDRDEFIPVHAQDKKFRPVPVHGQGQIHPCPCIGTAQIHMSLCMDMGTNPNLGLSLCMDRAEFRIVPMHGQGRIRPCPCIGTCPCMDKEFDMSMQRTGPNLP